MKSHCLLPAICLGAACAFAGADAAAQTTANGSYYAVPSWDQTLPVASRFVVLSNFENEAVLDRESGLVWQRTPTSNTATAGTRFSLGSAQGACGGAVVGHRTGWRLPTRVELQTLYDVTATVAPALPAGSPFIGVLTSTNDTTFYWTSTIALDGFGASHDAVAFGPTSTHAIGFHVTDNSLNLVWCGRGPSTGATE